MLMTALIVSGAASVTLIDIWSKSVDTSESNALQRQADARTEVALAGDPMNVNYDSATGDITLYLQNIGANELGLVDPNIGVFVNGTQETGDIQSRTMVSGTQWITNSLLELVVRVPGLSDGDDVRVTIVVVSLSNPKGTDSISEVVRLV